MTEFLPELRGALAVLEALELRHGEELVPALEPSVAAYTGAPRDPAALELYIQQAVELQQENLAAPYLVRCLRTGRAAGCTRLANLEWWAWGRQDPYRREGSPDALEIGWTWLAPWARGTGLNPDAKRLLLGDSFERLRVKRVTLKTDRRNERSRQAIERLGARLDGVLRCHLPAGDGGCRDSAVYSILEAEWPAVRQSLEARVARHLG